MLCVHTPDCERELQCPFGVTQSELISAVYEENWTLQGGFPM